MTEITGELIKTDRARRKMSRNQYAQLTGLTPTKVGNIENGRTIRPQEAELLAPHVQDLLGAAPPDGNGAQPQGETQTVPDVPPLAPVVPLAPTAAPVATTPPPLPPGVLVTDQPVIALTEDEIEEDPGEDVITPGSGLPTRYEFEHLGYHVSNSELATLRRCRRKWYLAYYRELRLRTQEVTGVRALGTRLHLALAAYYSTRREDPTQVLEYTLSEDQRLLEARAQEVDVTEALANLNKDADLARAMLEGYLAWVRETGTDEGLEFIADEAVVEAPFMSPEQSGWQPVVLVGKLDLRLRRTFDGARLFLDHKSVGSLTEPLKTLPLDSQMLMYHLLEHLDFLRAGMAQEDAEREHTLGGLYNMLRRVKRTAQAKPPFYQRVEVRHNLHELNATWVQVWGEVLEIARLSQALDSGVSHQQAAYPSPTRDCAWDCDFLPVCAMMNDGSDWEGMVAAYYEKADPHDHYAPYGEREHERSEA